MVLVLVTIFRNFNRLFPVLVLVSVLSSSCSHSGKIVGNSGNIGKHCKLLEGIGIILELRSHFQHVVRFRTEMFKIDKIKHVFLSVLIKVENSIYVNVNN